MLHFPGPLTPAAEVILVYCLEIAADMALPETLGDEWAIVYPLSATCFTPERAREALLDLLDKLRLPQEYLPTTYHWLLMYECLEIHIECLHDDPLPSLVQRFKASMTPQDASYLRLSSGSRRQVCVTINFDAFIDTYFWDTDFLLDPSIFYQLGPTPKEQFGYQTDLFSVLSGLTPHPTELVLKQIDEDEATAPDAESYGEV